MADARAVEYVRELERDDERLARALEELRALAAEVEELRTRAAAIVQLRERLPEHRAAAEEAVAEAGRGLDARRAGLDGAEVALAEAERHPDDRERLAAARRDALRARDDVASADRRLERAREALERLEEEARRADEDEPRLEVRAREPAERMRAFSQLVRAELGAPVGGLPVVIDWADRAHGALFVARNNLETERERVVRQANELLANVTGEPAPASTVARARELLESRA